MVFSVERPDLLPVRVGRQMRGPQPHLSPGDEPPAVSPVLKLTGASIPATERGGTDVAGACNRQSYSGRVGKEGGKTARAEDCEAEICKGPHDSKGR